MRDSTSQPLDKALSQLEALLKDELLAHEQLRGLMHRKRGALAAADREQLTDCCREENAKVQTISELAKRRLQIVADVTLLVDAAAAGPMRLGELAEQLPEPQRGRILVLRQQLREQMRQVQHESSVARRTTEALMRHMQGLVQTIGGMVAGGGTYGREGAPPRAALAMSTFSTTG